VRQQQNANAGRFEALPAVSESSDFNDCHDQTFVFSQTTIYVHLIVSHKEIDWPGLRAAAVAIGIRKAARQAARDLPPDEQERFVQRAMKRCSREKWLVKAQQDKANAIATPPSALSANIRSGADVLANALYDESRAKRMNVASALCKAAEHLAGRQGEKLLQPQNTRALKNLAQLHRFIFG